MLFFDITYKVFSTYISGKEEVLELMDIKRNPFPEKPPKFIRMQLYHYHFTGPTNKIETQGGVNWWSREFKGEYLPAISLEHAGVKDYLTKMGILSSKKSSLKDTNTTLKKCLNFMRELALQVEPHILLWTISLVLLPILYTAVSGINS